jgi:hypothetical protein
MTERRKAWLLVTAVLVLAAISFTIFLSGRAPLRVNPGKAGVRGESVAAVNSLPLSERPAGTIMPFRGDSNPMTQSIAEAIDTETHPERLTPMIGPEPFDVARYQANEQTYLNTVEPGRVWQVAQPGENVPRIVSASAPTHYIAPGETVVLRLNVPAGMPATFTSFDLGAFENLLTTITVKADAKGVAQAAFTASSGTIGTVNILAASPVTSGQMRYIVYVADDQSVVKSK